MGPFHRLAVISIVRDSSVVAFAAGMLMVATSVNLPLCFAIGAGVALVFSFASVVRATRLTEERLIRSEPWRGLEAEERPAGELGRRQARDDYRRMLLVCAKSAAGNAIVLFAASLIVSFGVELFSSQTIEIAWLN